MNTTLSARLAKTTALLLASASIASTLGCASTQSCTESSTCTTTCNADPASGQWVDLFNGKDLTGWTSEGDLSAWAVQDGELVTVKPGQGWWIRTDKMYRDFELTLDFYMPEGGNSGIGLRGSSNGDPAFTGFEVQILDTYNDEPGHRNCGAVYEAIVPDAMAVKAPGNWNTYRISLIGDTLNVWLNGIKIHSDQKLDDRGFYRSPDAPLPLSSRAPTGYIALQDHGHPFRYRNIKIKDLSPDPEPQGMTDLINEDLSNWFAQDNATWKVESGAIVGRDGPGHLFSRETYTDFEFRALVRVNERGNSGMYFRVSPNPDPNNPWPIGYEAQVDNNDPKNYTGVVYDKAYPSIGLGAKGPVSKDNAWFDYRVRVEGDRVRTWVNSIRMVDATLNEFHTGRLGLQGHHKGNIIEYRDLRILPLNESSND